MTIVTLYLPVFNMRIVHNTLILLIKSASYIVAYLIFVIFFTQAKFLENKIYTEKRQFFALNL